jgi:hypothetical protein
LRAIVNRADNRAIWLPHDILSIVVSWWIESLKLLVVVVVVFAVSFDSRATWLPYDILSIVVSWWIESLNLLVVVVVACC